MDATELRALQAPLKQRYREAPETARVVARAEANAAAIMALVQRGK